MSAIVLIDTVVLLNILNVPSNNQDRQQVMQDLENQHIRQDNHLLLPMATVLETGNHIADLRDGGHRHKYGTAFVQLIRKAILGEEYWKVMPFPDPQAILTWLDQFPDDLTRKIGFSDATIINEWKKQCHRAPMSRVFIWSLDKKMLGYDRIP